MKNETSKKCEAILRMLVDIVNSKGDVKIERDFGKNTLTVAIENQGHFHIGERDGSFEFLIDGFYSNLHKD